MILVLACACGLADDEVSVPADPEEAALERVLSDPSIGAARSEVVPPAQMGHRFPWLADLLPPLLDPNAELDLRRTELEAAPDDLKRLHAFARTQLIVGLHEPPSGHAPGLHLTRAHEAYQTLLDGLPSQDYDRPQLPRRSAAFSNATEGVVGPPRARANRTGVRHRASRRSRRCNGHTRPPQHPFPNR